MRAAAGGLDCDPVVFVRVEQVESGHGGISEVEPGAGGGPIAALEGAAFEIVPSGDRTGIRDEGTLEKLETIAYSDPVVKQAAIAMYDATGAAFYAGSGVDLTTEARAAYDRLANLCGIKRTL